MRSARKSKGARRAGPAGASGVSEAEGGGVALPQLTSHLRDAVWLCDADPCRVRYCSAAFETIFGRPLESVPEDRRHFVVGVHRLDLRRVESAIVGMLEGGECDVEFRIVRPDGTIRWVRRRGYRVRDPSGRVRRYVGTNEDVTARREAERRLRELERTISRVADDERSRIARDLHDGLGGRLSAIDIHHQMLVDAIAEGRVPSLGDAERVAGLIRDGITEVRRLTRGLRPVGADPDDLVPILRELAAEVGRRGEMACRFRCVGAVTIGDAQTANELYRIAQEAVNNALKHSGATHVAISLAGTERAAVLTVTDDGVGFEPAAGGGEGPAAGLGLEIMRHRAHSVGGELRIERRTEKSGTRVRCVVPRIVPPVG